MPSKILITRPQPKADRLAGELAARGLVPLVEPLMKIEPVAFTAPRGQVQAYLLTSANATPALASLDPEVPVFAVGRATADAAAATGARRVVTAGGDARDLARTVAAQCRPGHGMLLHLCGEEVRPGLDAALVRQGFDLERRVVYRAVAASMLSPALRAELERRTVGAALLFSPRSAAILVDLVLRYGLAATLGEADALCLSEAVAEPCRALRWRRVAVAGRPAQPALLELLEGAGRRW